MKSWIYILAASIIEVFWAICLKNLSLDKIIASIKQYSVFSQETMSTIYPLIGYIILGIVNAYLISLSFKSMPISIAFGAFTGLALTFNFLFDTFYYKVSFTPLHILFLTFILIGIIGLKSVSTK